MNLNKTVATLCATSAIAFAASPLQTAIAQAVGTTPNAGNKPNFVTIVLDDMGFSDMGAFGGEIPTPNMDKLANDGITLTNFHTAPTSSPSRAMLFTGKDNHHAGMGTMGGWQHPAQEGESGYEGYLPQYVPTFFELLQTGGYYTMMTGKWDMLEDAPVDDLSNYFAVNRGFDDARATLLLGGDTQFSEEDGTVITAHLPGRYKHYKREHSLYNDNGLEMEKFPREFYSTEYYTDMAIEMVDKWQSESQDKPFYLNVSHTAPHSPWQAPPEVTAKYLDVYAQGWDVIRQQRFERQKQLGLWSQDMELPPRPDDVPAWDSLDEAEQKYEAKKMAIYAAMIDILDQNVKRLVDHLKDIGEYENTVFLIFSDNGAAPGLSAFNVPARRKYLNEKFDNPICYQDGKLDNECYERMGTRHWYGGTNIGWAMLSNTPFNNYKGDTFEGGVHTLGFFHYPQAEVTGEKSSCLTSIMDVAPTILEMANVVYPSTYNGQYNPPMQGVSMANLFENAQYCDQNRWIGWELDSGKGLHYGDWKLSQQWDVPRNRWNEQVFMFDLKSDPFERENLVEKEPEKFQEMLALHKIYATENNIIEVGGIILKELGAISENGQKTEDAMVTGGVTVNYGRRYGIEKTAKQFVDSVAIDGQIRPKMEHRGLAADVLVLSMYSASPEAQPVPLVLTKTGLEIWNEQAVVTLPSFMTISELPDRLPIPIYEGIAVGPIGHFDLWFGYRLADGTLVYNEEVIKFEVTE